jgi:hypothetical protein
MEATSQAIQPMKVLRGERRRNVKLELEEFVRVVHRLDGPPL